MAWTNITANVSWQDLAAAREIAVAYNHRADVCGTPTLESALGVTVIDSSVTVYDFIHACQTGIETMCLHFSDKAAVLINQTSSPSNFATVVVAMTAAGLTQTGYWRRIAEGDTQPNDWTIYNATGWSYGKITSKDLAGPWLFKDIQTALSSLRRCVFTTTEVTDGSGNATSKYAHKETVTGFWPIPGTNPVTYTSDWSHDPCGLVSGNVVWSNGVTYPHLIRSVKSRTYNAGIGGDINTTSCDVSARLYKATYPFVSWWEGGDTPDVVKFIGLINSGSEPFTALTGYQLASVGKTVDMSLTLAPGIRYVTNWVPFIPAYTTPAWQGIADVCPDPVDPKILEWQEVRALIISSVVAVFDFNSWVN